MRIFEASSGNEIVLDANRFFYERKAENYESDSISDRLSPPPLFASNEQAPSEIELREREVYHQLGQMVELATEIPTGDQILLCADGTLVVPHVSTVSPHSGRVQERCLLKILESDSQMNVYVYDGRGAASPSDFMAAAPRHEAEEVPDVEPLIARNVFESLLTAFDGEIDKERLTEMVESAYALARAIVGISERHVETCKLWSKQTFVQLDALQSGMLNLESSVLECKSVFEAVSNRAKTAFKEHATLLDAFDTDLTLLARFPIPKTVYHSGLVDPSQTVDDWTTMPLTELVPVDKLIPWKAKCQYAHEQLVKKHGDLLLLVSRLDNSAACEFADYPERSDAAVVDGAKNSLSKMHDTLAEMQSLVDRLMEKPQEFEPLDSQLETQRKILTTWLPSCYVEAESIYSNSVIPLFQLKRCIKARFSSTVSNIASVQEQIAHIQPQLRSLELQLNSVSSAFLQLNHVHRMPAALGGALLELYRRQQNEAFQRAQVQAIARLFGSMRESELQERENFAKRHGHYLPKSLFGDEWLHQSPLLVDVSLKASPSSIDRQSAHSSESLPTLTQEQMQLLSEKISGDSKGTPNNLDAALDTLVQELDEGLKHLESRPWETFWCQEGAKSGLYGVSTNRAPASNFEKPFTTQCDNAIESMSSSVSIPDSASTSEISSYKDRKPFTTRHDTSAERQQSFGVTRAQDADSMNNCEKLIADYQLALNDCKFLVKLAVGEVIKYANLVNKTFDFTKPTLEALEFSDVKNNSLENFGEFIENMYDVLVSNSLNDGDQK